MTEERYDDDQQDHRHGEGDQVVANLQYRALEMTHSVR